MKELNKYHESSMFIKNKLSSIQQQNPAQSADLWKKSELLAKNPEEFYKFAEELGWQEGKKYSWSIK
jgi:hypothetical protein